MPENEPLALDYMWLASKVVMTNETREAFAAAYTTDCKFSAILRQLQGDGNEAIPNALKQGVPFELINRLLYHIGPRPDYTRHLCIPYTKVQEILEMAYDQKYYFGVKHILYDLDNL